MKRRKMADDPIVRTVQEHGFSKSMRAALYVVAWLQARDKLGHDPSIEEYRDYWKSSTATAYRERQAFTEVYGVASPAVLVRRLEAAGVDLSRPNARKDRAVLLSVLGAA